LGENERMNKQRVKEFLEALGCSQIQVNAQSDWVKAACPLAAWTHEGGADRNPSFGVKATDDSGGVPTYHCFACGSSGTLPKLLHNIQMFSGEHNKEAADILSSEELGDDGEHGDSKAETRKRKVISKDKWAKLERDRKRRNVPVPETILQKFPLVTGLDDWRSETIVSYMREDRKIKESLIDDYQLRVYQDPIRQHVGIIFPIYNREGTQVMDMYVRMIHAKSFFRLNARLTDSKVNYQAPNLWFGNQFYDPERPLILVEGAFDVLRLRTLGVTANLWAAMGNVSDDQIDKIHARTIYLAFDADSTGKGYMKKVAEKVEAPARYVLRWDIVDKKDPGELRNLDEFKTVFANRFKLERPIKPTNPPKPKFRKPNLTIDPFDI